MTRYIILCLAACLYSQFTVAQFITTLALKNVFPGSFADWANDNTSITYIVNNQGGEPYKVIIKTELKLTDGTTIATKDLSRSAVYTLSQGNNVFYTHDVLPLDIVTFFGSYEKAMQQTGKLPPGNYQLSVQMVYVQGYAPITPLATKNFVIPNEQVQLPVLMKPYRDEILNYAEAQTALIFRWTPAIYQARQSSNYRIQVFEVLAHQQPVQALRSNQPLLDITVRNQTQYIWRPQLPFDENSKKFIWTIQLLDANDLPVTTAAGNNEARSEPSVFFIAKKVLIEYEEN